MPKLPINDPRIVWPDGRSPGWTHTDAGLDGGKFGSISHCVYGDFKEDGRFHAQFDRPVVAEGPHAIAIPYGRDLNDGKFKMGLVKEQRDTAAAADGKTSVSYWGPPRGFAEPGDEGAVAMALRETCEETGANVLVHAPIMIGNFITNETCTATLSPIVAVPVNLSRIDEIKKEDGRGEKIFKSDFFTLKQVHEMIIDGEYDGALTTSMVLGQVALLYQLHLQYYETVHPENIPERAKNAWYP